MAGAIHNNEGKRRHDHPIDQTVVEQAVRMVALETIF